VLPKPGGRDFVGLVGVEVIGSECPKMLAAEAGKEYQKSKIQLINLTTLNYNRIQGKVVSIDQH